MLYESDLTHRRSFLGPTPVPEHIVSDPWTCWRGPTPPPKVLNYPLIYLERKTGRAEGRRAGAWGEKWIGK